VDGAQLEESGAAKGLGAADAARPPGLEHELDFVGSGIRRANGWRGHLGRDEVVGTVHDGGRLTLGNRGGGGAWACRVGGRGDGCQCEEGEVSHGNVVRALGQLLLRNLSGDGGVDSLLHGAFGKVNGLFR